MQRRTTRLTPASAMRRTVRACVGMAVAGMCLMLATVAVAAVAMPHKHAQVHSTTPVLQPECKPAQPVQELDTMLNKHVEDVTLPYESLVLDPKPRVAALIQPFALRTTADVLAQSVANELLDSRRIESSTRP